ncbi:MAG TPA: reverse transcriptase family protein [Mycobacteriales bacterium]|nr:reverse transcriptase family protein [Mycobacteriales bacterium]
MTRRKFTPTELDWLGDVAGALADALLVSDWQFDAMVARARETVGESGRWIGELVRAVHFAYPEPPTGSPRELTRFLMTSPPLPEIFGHALDTDRSPPIVVRRIIGATRMADAGCAVPRWHTTVDLGNHLGLTTGELDWFADTRGWEARVTAERLRHYRYRLLAKRHGGHRLLESPKWQLRELQRRILHEVLDNIPVHDAAHGFHAGRSPATHAAAHVGARCVIRMDLENFFGRVTAGRVWGLFRLAGYPEQVAYALTGLTTNIVPAAVRRTLAVTDPVPAAWLGVPHLPQGAPTSPALANLAAFRLDRRLQRAAEQFDSRYSRYADDLAFSGGPDLLRAAPGFLALVRRIAQDEGFGVNPFKTAVVSNRTRQQLTGLVVNERLNVPRVEFDRLKATLHNAVAYGPASQNRGGHLDFRAHLAGRVAWVSAVNAARGARLRRDFDRIDWTA